jgi:hypothetical protein
MLGGSHRSDSIKREAELRYSVTLSHMTKPETMQQVIDVDAQQSVANEIDVVPNAEVIDLHSQQQRLNGDAQASAAQTPARKTVKDFFQKVTTEDHIKKQDALMESDVMDLRSVRTYRRQPVRKRRVGDADAEEDDDEADAAEGDANFAKPID